jgi:DNA-binding transcriptional regulator YhcF (GntR family)
MIQRKSRRRRAGRSPLQDEIVQFIAAYRADPANGGNSPTYREIADGLEKNVTTIYDACRRLERRGLIDTNERGKLVLKRKRPKK